jgi:hypothetical protein
MGRMTIDDVRALGFAGREDYMREFRNRAKGAMYGVAIGDALGAPLEFMDALEIKDVHGPEPVRESFRSQLRATSAIQISVRWIRLDIV